MNKDIMKRLYYFSMFDGGLYIPKAGRHAHFSLSMTRDHLDFVQRAQQTLEEAGIGTRLYDRPDYSPVGHTWKPSVRLESRTHPLLTKIHERIYLDRHKVCDPHMLKMMDAEALTIAYMADGSCSVDLRCHATPQYRLNTCGLNYGDNWLLKKCLKDVFDLEFNIYKNGQYYFLYLRSKDSEKFGEIIRPHLCESFMYKLKVRTRSPYESKVVR